MMNRMSIRVVDSALRRNFSLSVILKRLERNGIVVRPSDHNSVANDRHTRWLSSTRIPQPTEWVTQWRGATVGFPKDPSKAHEARQLPSEDYDSAILPLLHNFNLNIPANRPCNGGHALLGSNASGKSLLTAALTDPASHVRWPHHTPSSSDTSSSASPIVSTVSFESHQALLTDGGSVHTALQSHDNTGLLSKAAQFLVVRFGLYAFLSRDVRTLSTGEIRKVLLLRALAIRPDLLVLDNAMDGLDVASRTKMSALVNTTIRGFRPDILVQGVSAKHTARTQVVLATHRAEELVEGITTATILSRSSSLSMVRTEERNGRTGEEWMQSVYDTDEDAQDSTRTATEDDSDPVDPWDDDASLPSMDEIAAMWNSQKHASSTLATTPSPGSTIVQLRDFCLIRGDTQLLHVPHWTVAHGERWLVAGGNGAGKSSVSRLLTDPNAAASEHSGSFHVSVPSGRVGFVSTERHLHWSHSMVTAREILLGVNSDDSLTETAPSDVGESVARWLNVQPDLLSRPFARLSQGEQKMVLLGNALAKRPELLIIDEPLQGLDRMNRRRILGLVERVCRATATSLVYVTHHFEEVIPSVTHVLHLKNGSPVFQGVLTDYDPTAL